ncbi:integration host factor subunit beta [Hyalangium versicolor]|uniref:integration host factor subunit beta n=1 Tax=Hyalangium versicolor TaxID=2861190 RepID=UPI00359FD195
MTKSQLVERIAQKAPQLHPRQIEAVVNAIFEQMTQALKAGERIELRGFGCFCLKARPARIGRNPKTGAPVALSRRFAVSFAAGKELRERINRALPAPEPVSRLPLRLPSTSVMGASALNTHPGVTGGEAPRI